ncbi:MAG: hypothetical protein NTW20_08125 [Rhodobacterales bacterium]|nr:hypothetical protein [Rhodobacterales bacterium]
MKKAFAAAALLGLIGSALYAGGPVIVTEEEPAVVAEAPASSGGWVIPVILLAVIGLAITSGGDDRARVSTW